MMRYIVLDTETTGFTRNGARVSDKHRIIEIGAVELDSGRQFHVYINPGMPIDPAATDVHGIGDDDVLDMPSFPSIAASLIKFISGAVIIMHNAPFDIDFLDMEFERLPVSSRPVDNFIFIDTLQMARQMFPGQKNDLNALSLRVGVLGRNGVHGALIDAKVLAQVYRKMLGS